MKSQQQEGHDGPALGRSPEYQTLSGHVVKSDLWRGLANTDVNHDNNVSIGCCCCCIVILRPR